MHTKILFIFSVFFLIGSLSADCQDCHCNKIYIKVVKSPEEIDVVKSRDIIVKSFMHAYEDIPLVELNPDFKSTGDVRRFYENYFAEEFERFKEGHVIWVEAYINNKLGGWATFELEPLEDNAAYMDLLIVDPNYHKMGLGKMLTFSICSEELFPNVRAINLLIRKVNIEGYKFYRNIGFFEYDYHRGNFVDPALLTGLRWERKEN